MRAFWWGLFWFWWLIAALAAMALGGCGGGSVIKPDIIETRTVTNTVTIPVPVACIKEEDVPALPELARVDTKNATTDQLAAAIAANSEAFKRYSDAVSKLLDQCTGGLK